MSDGMSDGYRMELEAKQRDERMAAFGKTECFYCGTAMPDGPAAKEPASWERHMHIQGAHASGGRPVSLMPSEIGFCSSQCKEWWSRVCDALSTVRIMVENGASPAVKVSLLRSIEKALMETRKHV